MLILVMQIYFIDRNLLQLCTCNPLQYLLFYNSGKKAKSCLPYSHEMSHCVRKWNSIWAKIQDNSKQSAVLCTSQMSLEFF